MICSILLLSRSITVFIGQTPSYTIHSFHILSGSPSSSFWKVFFKYWLAILLLFNEYQRTMFHFWSHHFIFDLSDLTWTDGTDQPHSYLSMQCIFDECDSEQRIHFSSLVWNNSLLILASISMLSHLSSWLNASPFCIPPAPLQRPFYGSSSSMLSSIGTTQFMYTVLFIFYTLLHHAIMHGALDIVVSMKFWRKWFPPLYSSGKLDDSYIINYRMHCDPTH